jgi:hypothetical protein
MGIHFGGVDCIEYASQISRVLIPPRSKIISLKFEFCDNGGSTKIRRSTCQKGKNMLPVGE